MDTTNPDPLVGRLLDGRYLIQARVARGGMASVYRATDQRLDRPVAVKVMQPVLAESDDFVRRFIREAQSAARLSHPNVVNVFDQGRDGDVVFLVMEYVDGNTLRDVLRAAGRLTPGQVVAVLEPIAAALGAAHRAGIVHRDMKPENVLIATDGRVKVADFGLARAIESSSITMTQGTLIGSPAYLAPEQVERGVADQRADVYAVGVMAYELLAGSPPYTGDMAMAVALRHVREDVPAPSSVVDGVPAPLDELIVAATRRDPDARPHDGGVLLERVQAVHRTVAAEPLDPGPAEPLDVNQTMVLGAPPRSSAAAVVGETAPDAPRRRLSAGWLWLFVVLALGVGAAVYGAAVLAGGGSKGGVEVAQTQITNFSNLTINEARASAPKLTIERADTEYSRDVAKGKILRQDPPPGALAPENATVKVVVSDGPRPVKVPEVQGRTLFDATATLEAAGLTVGKESSAFHSTIAAGLVIGTSPGKGKTLHEGDTVELIRSEGPDLVSVTDQRGEPEADALAALKGREFKVTVKRVYSNTVEAGRVISQDPFNGRAERKSTIKLTVSKGPQYFTLSDYKGQKIATVEANLAKLGVKVSATTAFPGGPKEVVAQRPGAGSKVKAGDTVRFVVF